MQYNSVIFICCNSHSFFLFPSQHKLLKKRKEIPALIYKEAPIHSA